MIEYFAHNYTLIEIMELAYDISEWCTYGSTKNPGGINENT